MFDKIDRSATICEHLAGAGAVEFDQTKRAVAHFTSGYLSAADGGYLKSGGYSVKYLDYDWSLNEK